MLKPWTPVGPTDPKTYDIYLLVLANEAHRDAIVMAHRMCDIVAGGGHYHQREKALSEEVMKVDLRGGYGIVIRRKACSTQLIDAEGSFRVWFNRRAQEYNTEAGWPYAWRFHWHSHVGPPKIEGGRSPCNRGSNLKDVIRRSMDDLVSGTYREKGVVYD